MSRNLASHLIHSWLWVFLSIFPLNGSCFPNANPCPSKSTCGECIQTPTCGWCYQPPERFRGIDRCFQPANQYSTAILCPEEYIYSPMNALQYLFVQQPTGELYLSPQKMQAKLSVDSSMYIDLNSGVGGSNLPIPIIELKDNASSYVDIVYYSKCSNEAGPEIPTNKCTNIKGQVQFKIEIKLKECPKNPEEFSEIIGIYVVGEYAVSTIDLSMLCSCPCEKPGSLFYEENSPRCNGGTSSCGTCICKDNAFGSRCQCSSEISVPTGENCIEPDSTNGIQCSGKGSCICGQCECDTRVNIEEVISGTWCECDNFSCDRQDGVMCGGHGICECGQCLCEPPWTGAACGCYNNISTCIPAFSDMEACSGHGLCTCGTCECESTPDGGYTGRYCQHSPNSSGSCAELTPCVLCQGYNLGPYDEETCVANCTNFTPVEVGVLQVSEESDEFLCIGYDENSCKYQFVYSQIDSDNYVVRIPAQRDCPLPEL